MDTIERKYTAKEAMQSVVEYLKDDAVRATQVITIRTISESDRRLFVRMFSHWLHKNQGSIFLLTDSVSSSQLLKERVEAKCKGIKIVETATFEEHGISDDMILNRINGAEADCVVAALPQEKEELFVQQNRKNLHVKLWFSLGCKKDWKQESTWLDKMKMLVSGTTQKTK